MAQTVTIEGGQAETENRYVAAGWLAIVGAVLFPIAFIISIIQGVIGAKLFDYTGPTAGPSDILFLGFTIIGVYVLVMFRRLLNERYDFHAIDTLIIASIIWSIAFELGGMAIRWSLISIWPVPETLNAIIQGTFFVASMLVVGVIDIIIGVQMLKHKERFSDLLRAYAYISLISGILEVTVILTPITLLLVPVSLIILGIAFLREKEGVEFV